jgi:hypothetical protein
MRVPRRVEIVIPVVLTVLLLAGGCREDPEVAAADERMCEASGRLGDALRAFNDPDAGAGDRAAARDELFDAMAEMSHASSEVAQAEAGAGNNPIQDLNEDLQDTPDDATLAEIAEDMVVAGGDFLEGVKQLVVGRDC